MTFDNRLNEPAENEGNQLILGTVHAVSDALAVPAGRSRVYVCEPSGPEAETCRERIVTTFAQRAWRRPLTRDERTHLLTLYRGLSATEGADEAIMLVVRAVLVSPRFLYRPSFKGESRDDLFHPPEAEPKQWLPLDDYVLASRLSYFLWSSMPDQQLFDDAAVGALRSDDGLRAAVTRMLADPRSSALRTGFAASWLGVTSLATAAPDPTVYPAFSAELKAAMAEESGLFFDDFLHNGEAATQMLSPDFGYLNDTLATHYGLPLPGSRIVQRVNLTVGQRRGVLMQGAWLTSTSDPTHTSPVRRGRWVLEQLLGEEIPPPPPGIPPLVSDSSAGTIRERLAEHRKSPACAGCHNRVDPVGLGLEEFDGIAATRALENGNPVDRSGAIGTNTFVGAEAMAGLLRDDPRFLPTLVSKLHTYAMGRAKVEHDAAFIDSLTAQLANRGNRLDALVELIVLSPSFRMTPIEGSP